MMHVTAKRHPRVLEKRETHRFVRNIMAEGAWAQAGKAVADAVAKPFKEAPGWVYLGLILYLATPTLLKPYSVCLGSWLGWYLCVGPTVARKFGSAYETVVLSHREFIATVLTSLFYWLGDLLDKLVYPREDRINPPWKLWLANEKRFETEQRGEARKALEIGEGSYAAAKALVQEAETVKGTWSMLANEIAKVCRSIAIPLVLSGGMIAWYCGLDGALAALAWVGGLALAVVVFLLFPQLKSRHVESLYKLATQVANAAKADPKKSLKVIQIDGDGVTMLFWKGKFLAAGLSYVPAVAAQSATPDTVEAAQ
jgi:hypothetical protein